MTNKITKFVFRTYLLTWILWGSLGILTFLNVIKFNGVIFTIFFIVGGNSPFIISFLMKKMGENKEDYVEFKKQLFKFKVNPLWYLWVVVIPFSLFLITWIIYATNQNVLVALFRQEFYMLFILVIVNIILGGLEEVGWRGFLLPMFLKRFSILASTLMTSIIWSLWHIPLWFIVGTSQYNSNFLFFVLFGLSISLLLTILYLKTKSILLCVLFHSLVNSYASLVNVPFLENYSSIITILAFSIIIFVVSFRKDVFHIIAKSYEA